MAVCYAQLACRVKASSSGLNDWLMGQVLEIPSETEWLSCILPHLPVIVLSRFSQKASTCVVVSFSLLRTDAKIVRPMRMKTFRPS